jgi:hypothetical protein
MQLQYNTWLITLLTKAEIISETSVNVCDTAWRKSPQGNLILKELTCEDRRWIEQAHSHVEMGPFD